MFKDYDSLSAGVRAQIDGVKQLLLSQLGKDVRGIYLHGSIALNCFVEGQSDIDMLVVVDRHLDREERLCLAEGMIALDYKPSPLEISAIHMKDLNPWHFPTPCQFHYSDFWTTRYQQMSKGDMTYAFIIDTDFEDADIACHAKLTKQCGICIYGEAIADVFPDVPEADFWASISADVNEFDFDACNKRYFASNVLTLGRILSYKMERRILSKYEGALWTRVFLPEKYRYIIDEAIKVWYHGQDTWTVKDEDLNAMRDILIRAIVA